MPGVPDGHTSDGNGHRTSVLIKSCMGVGSIYHLFVISSLFIKYPHIVATSRDLKYTVHRGEEPASRQA